VETGAGDRATHAAIANTAMRVNAATAARHAPKRRSET